ncbi:MAG: hypothetical protein KF744_11595 [Taibaiella sp.]|nr:hypothetical protein [Taibaiella sp.]
MEKQKIDPRIDSMIPLEYRSIKSLLNAEKVNEHYKECLPIPLSDCVKKMPDLETKRFNMQPSFKSVLERHKMDNETLSKWAEAFNRLLEKQGVTEMQINSWFGKFAYWLRFEDTAANPEDRN